MAALAQTSILWHGLGSPINTAWRIVPSRTLYSSMPTGHESWRCGQEMSANGRGHIAQHMLK
eukprot:12771059-Heterocapsa_arctica.AAC.1